MQKTALFKRFIIIAAVMAVSVFFLHFGVLNVKAQYDSADEAVARAEEELRGVKISPEAENAAAGAETPAEGGEEAARAVKNPTLLELIRMGGWMMYPIGFMSLLVVGVGLERFVALHLAFVAPRRFFRQLDAMSVEKTDPRKIYNLCRQYPSAASRIVAAALTKVGRPMLEVQGTLQEANDNEAQRMFGNVRILILAATITPLMGLLGTVIGMIEAFMVTANMDATVAGVNRASQLSGGIYQALITTCAGLMVAIPAAILAHWYEGRIQRIFLNVDQKLTRFVVYLADVEGKVHVTPEQYEAYYEASRRVASGMPTFGQEAAATLGEDVSKKPGGGK